MLKVAVLGLGNRGRVYGSYLAKSKEVEITAICDKYQEKIDNVKQAWRVPAERCLTDERDLWALGKIGDAMVIASQDRDHYRHAVKALELGYHLLLEKPVSPVLEECLHLEQLAREKGLIVTVCHVLRYARYYRRINEIVKSGLLGDIKLIRHNENIGYWHFVHSYVRGNWRDEQETSPLLLAKCCHDMDLLYWWAGSRAKSVSSYGDLSYFKEENAPEGAAERCVDCSLNSSCIFDAEQQYIGKNGKKKSYKFGTYAFSVSGSREDILQKIKTGSYGRCAYRCDNNVVDTQVVNIEFANNIRCAFTVNAFNQDNYRNTHIHGTQGELLADDRRSVLILKIFGKGSKRIVVNIIPVIKGHYGGDQGIVNTFIRIMKGEQVAGATFISDTIESHRIVAAAEESRLSGRTVML